MEIKFVLSMEESNRVLGALGQMPYAQVAALIAKLREQAEPQIKPTVVDAE